MDAVPPGTALNPARVIPGKVRPSGRATAEVPCRTHLSVLDMRRFSPGRPGGGGVGHALGLMARATAEPSDEWRIESERPRVVEHIARVVASAAGYDGALRVSAQDHGIRHLGLGSTSALMTAVAVAANHSLGRPFDSRDIRLLVGDNFAEDHRDGVIPGFETGVGPAVGLYGGFVVMADDLAIARRAPLPEGWMAIIAVVAGEPGRRSGEDEAALLMNRARQLDDRDAGAKAHIVLSDLVPGMAVGDLGRMSAAISALQTMGSKVAEIEHHADPGGIRSLAREMADSGARLVGMSSVGPSVTGIAPDGEADAVASAIRSAPIVERVIVCPVDNAGYRVEVE